MKIKLIIAFCIMLVAAVGAWLYYSWYEDTYQTVTFDVKIQPITAKIVDDENQEVGLVSRNTSMTLKNGKYTVYPSGQNIDTSPSTFLVNKKDTTITIDPMMSMSTLNEYLEQELQDIQSVIVQKYPKLIAQFMIDKGKLLGKGDWYVTVLSYKNKNNDNPRDDYKTILKKVDGEWQMVGQPEIIPTKYTMPGVPADILTSAYNLSPEINN